MVAALAVSLLVVVELPAGATAASPGRVAYSCEAGTKKKPNLALCVSESGSGKSIPLTAASVSPIIGAAWSPDGRNIAMLCGWQRQSGEDAFPTRDLVDFGPDGFSRNGGGEVCVTTPDGKGGKVLTETGVQGAAQAPVWSPDGSLIAFAVGSGIVDNSSDAKKLPGQLDDGLYVIAPDGTGLQKVTVADDGSEPADFPTWSPDGTRLAFTKDHAINVIGVGGGASQSITDSDAIDLGPSWSPDGTKIAFTRFTPDDQRELWIVNPDGSGARKLASSPMFDNPNTGYDFTPQWSPDGSRLAVTTAPNGKAQIDVLNVADGTSKVVSPSSTKKKTLGAINATWARDGNSLAFLSDRSGGAFDIYTVRPDGTGLTQVTKDSTEEFGPALGPPPQ
jgi:Tol biopolymer transport system component